MGLKLKQELQDVIKNNNLNLQEELESLNEQIKQNFTLGKILLDQLKERDNTMFLQRETNYKTKETEIFSVYRNIDELLKSIE